MTIRESFIELTSVHNPRLQEIRRASSTGKPTRDGFVVIEGPHLLTEALRSHVAVHCVLTTAAGREKYGGQLARAGCEIIQVPARVFAQLASAETAKEVLALAKLPDWTWADLTSRPSALVLVLDAIQDPGNAGTLFRSAEAFGAAGLVLLDGCVRVSNPKFLRASAGSVFRVPFLEGLSVDDLLAQSRLANFASRALVPRDGTDIRSVNLRDSTLLVVGNEGGGISESLLKNSELISIPTKAVESLNASVACSIALFEAHNQRTVHELVRRIAPS